MEPCHSPYRNLWFLVKKKEKGKYWLINAVLNMNKVTIQDANLPPSVDEFSDDFAGCVVASFVDFFSGYDQASLAISSQDFTAFMTLLGLLHITQLPMGAINLVAQFVQIVTKILQDHIPHISRQFVENVGVKDPKTTYNNKEAAPGICCYMLEHIQSLDKVFADIKEAKATITRAKSQFCISGFEGGWLHLQFQRKAYG